MNMKSRMCAIGPKPLRCHYVLSLAPVAARNCSHAVALNPFDGEGLESEWEVDFLPQRCEFINLHTPAHSSRSDLNWALIAQTVLFLMTVSEPPNGDFIITPMMSCCGLSSQAQGGPSRT